MLEKYPPRIAVNKNGDHLITQGPANQPVLFISAGKQLAEFIKNPATAKITEITGVGGAAITACLAAGAEFESAWVKPVSLKLRLPNGLVVFFVNEHVAFDDDTWLIVHKGDILVTPYQVTLRTEEAFRHVRIPVYPAESLATGKPYTPEESAMHESVTAAVSERQKLRTSVGKSPLHRRHSRGNS